MYRRFLNNDDYLGIITPEALAQLTRGNDARFIQAEESAEMSIVEYLSENYEIEKELAKGKYIAEYDHRITYPVGVSPAGDVSSSSSEWLNRQDRLSGMTFLWILPT